MDRKLVVVQILPALNSGGVERGTIEVANYLVSQGHTAIVISAGGAMQQKLVSGVEHIKLNVGKKSLLSLLLIKKLQNLFVTKKVDIVHARSRLPAWLAYWALKKIKQNKPQFVTTIHGLYSVKKYSSIMARGNRVIAVSQTAADYVAKHYSQYLKSPACIIYRGININEFPYKLEPDFMWLQTWYQKHNQLVGHKMVLLAGRLTDLKGVKDLLLWLQSTDNDAKLVLTANPEKDIYATRLYNWFKQNNVEQRVLWVGWQSAIANLYALADVVVSPSTRAESFGRTVAESLAVGTPVVAYDHGGVGEILSHVFPHGKVEIGNQQQLANKINQFIKQCPSVINKQPFLLSSMLSQTITLYEDMTNDNK